MLVIDEVSMLSGDTLEAIDSACRAARDVWHKPFGGLQVVLVGDFFQLPPVIKEARNIVSPSTRQSGKSWTLPSAILPNGTGRMILHFWSC